MIEHVTSNDARLTQVNNRDSKLKHDIEMPNRVGAKQDKTSERSTHLSREESRQERVALMIVLRSAKASIKASCTGRSRFRVQANPRYSDAKLRPLALVFLDRSLWLPRLKNSSEFSERRSLMACAHERSRLSCLVHADGVWLRKLILRMQLELHDCLTDLLDDGGVERSM